MSEYIVLKGNIIIEHCCGSIPDNENCREVPDNWPWFKPGIDVRYFDEAMRLRPLADRIAEGLVTVSEREKVVGEMVAPKTIAELIRDGLEVPPRGQKLVQGNDDIHLERMTILEQVEAGQLTRECGTIILEANERARRGSLLAETDWTQTADQSDATKELWRPYRQALRDITNQGGWPWHIEWPKSPDGISQ